MQMFKYALHETWGKDCWWLLLVASGRRLYVRASVVSLTRKNH